MTTGLKGRWIKITNHVTCVDNRCAVDSVVQQRATIMERGLNEADESVRYM